MTLGARGGCAALPSAWKVATAESQGAVESSKHCQPSQEYPWDNPRGHREFRAVSTEVPKALTHNLHHRREQAAAAVAAALT